MGNGSDEMGLDFIIGISSVGRCSLFHGLVRQPQQPQPQQQLTPMLCGGLGVINSREAPNTVVPNSVGGFPAVDLRAGEGPDGAHDKALGTIPCGHN